MGQSTNKVYAESENLQIIYFLKREVIVRHIKSLIMIKVGYIENFGKERIP